MVLVGKPQRKSPLGRRRSEWIDNIKMGFQEIGWSVWSGLISFGRVSIGIFEQGD
jgi:hypothetical protein